MAAFDSFFSLFLLAWTIIYLWSSYENQWVIKRPTFAFLVQLKSVEWVWWKFTIYCNMSDMNGVGVTVVRHDSENRTRVKRCWWEPRKLLTWHSLNWSESVSACQSHHSLPALWAVYQVTCISLSVNTRPSMGLVGVTWFF